MASVLKVNTLTGVTTAGSIVVTGEGNSTTTNLQQGLAKAWNKTVAAGTGSEDSFGIGSLTDTGTGKQFHNFTNNMANDDYSMHVTNVDDNIEQSWADNVAVGGFLSNSFGASAFEDEKHSVTVFGDLA
tara:strand:+ start:159 stop:545 length:387 start_codon:yes stop_codon:yes gene_type:complete